MPSSSDDIPTAIVPTPGEALRLLDIEDGDMPTAKPFAELSSDHRKSYEDRATGALSLAWRIVAKMKETS